MVLSSVRYHQLTHHMLASKYYIPNHPLEELDGFSRRHHMVLLLDDGLNDFDGSHNALPKLLGSSISTTNAKQTSILRQHNDHPAWDAAYF